MTLQNAITQTDALKPNAYADTDKTAWLSRLDGLIHEELLSRYYPADGEDALSSTPFAGYDDETDPDTALLVPPPYDELYILYLSSQIDFYNGEYSRYNGSMALFNHAYQTFACAWNRTHRHRNRGPVAARDQGYPARRAWRRFPGHPGARRQREGGVTWVYSGRISRRSRRNAAWYPRSAGTTTRQP